MFPFQSSEYQQLPVEEKVEDEQPQAPIKKRNNKAFVALVVCLIAFALLFAFLGTRSSKHDDESQQQIFEEAAEAEFASFLNGEARATGQQYLLGVGKADITGPVVELNFMGYASLAQIGTGLRQRIYSRAFIVGDVNNPDNRFVYLVLDTACGDTAIRYGILEALANLGTDYSMYGQSNVAVTGTHAHSGPGAWLNYLLPQITSLGFDKQSYQAIVDGTVLSIQRAHASIAPGYLSYADTNITDANINRSLFAYLANPAAERAQYETTVDTTLTMLRFQRASDGLSTGVLAWHSVHGTSMLENNTHVTGGTSYLFEQAMISDSSAAPGFVAAFSQSSVGDTSPNVLGAYCDDGSGLRCGETEHSTCSGTSEACHGRGPEFQKLDLGVSSCYEIGRRVYAGAKALYDTFDSVATPVADSSVKFYHTFHDMQYYSFPLPNGTTVQTCPAALGYGFAGGTTDGPGAFDFVQGDNNTNAQNPLWVAVSGLLKTPSAAQVACQSPKPILLDVGEMDEPYAWSPNIVDIQSFRVGQFIIIVSPSEATTMTGRRWKAAVAAAATNASITSSTPKVVLGGPANTYAHYAATPEEYGVQRYEGASTLYGPWESYAYIHLSTSMIGYLAASNTSTPPAGPSPPDNSDSSLSFITGVVYDGTDIGKSFGQVLSQPNASYPIGSVVNATFVGANPRNNLRLEGTFTEVQQLVNGVWTAVRDDKDWFLSYSWYRDNGLTGTSHVVVSWETETYAETGTYRIVYYGDHKDLIGTITAFNGTSGNFTLT
ncbi:probable neutral ceramidase precursor [Phialocephala subalpina]|uniref:Neutral ceramidase n=1 Tax=Phialocephala subalpina TaxID=576137 RepID=A0A1L7XGJ3_9HELO|nr:probable neutral ceramidase precursor [Phialocephala subalpina]